MHIIRSQMLIWYFVRRRRQPNWRKGSDFQSYLDARRIQIRFISPNVVHVDSYTDLPYIVWNIGETKKATRLVTYGPTNKRPLPFLHSKIICGSSMSIPSPFTHFTDTSQKPDPRPPWQSKARVRIPRCTLYEIYAPSELSEADAYLMLVIRGRRYNFISRKFTLICTPD